MVIGGQRIEEAIRTLHAHPIKAVISTTGGGVGILPLLWEQPGMSGTILDTGCPYHRIALGDALGISEDDTKCRHMTAIRMAVAAYEWAEQITQRDARLRGMPIVGLGITAAVASNPPRKRPDWFHAAALGPNGLRRVDVSFEQGGVDRRDQGRWADLVGLSLLLDAAGLETVSFRRDWGVTCDELGPEEYGVSKILPRGEGIIFDISPHSFWDHPLHHPDGSRSAGLSLEPDKHILYPGSFNPVQYAHVEAAKMAERQTGKEVVFSITTNHPDKGDVPMPDLISRRMQFRWRHPLLFTKSDSLFIDKARFFPGFAFLIGADVMLGILNPKYYGSEALRNSVLAEFTKLGTRFMVVGREVAGRGFLTHKDIAVPDGYSDLFEPVSGRWDIRSTDLR